MIRRVAVLATGGTIAGTGEAPTLAATYEAATVPVDRLLAALPALAGVAEIVCEQVSQIDSKNMTLALWVKLRQRVQAALDDPETDGVVVIHGTDTLEETAYWLHLATAGDKPVVLTGAMRPSTALSADGPTNLYDAVVVAACPSSRGRGVVVVLAGRVHGARDVAKTSTDALTAFQSGEAGVLGRVCDGQVAWLRMGQDQEPYRSDGTLHGFARTWASSSDLPRVDIVVGYSDVQRDQVDAVVAAGALGIVVAGFGNGSLNPALLSSLTAAATSGIAVVRASRIGSGWVNRNATEQDDVAGFVASGSLSPWKARILLMLGLAMGHRSVNELQTLFDRS